MTPSWNLTWLVVLASEIAYWLGANGGRAIFRGGHSLHTGWRLDRRGRQQHFVWQIITVAMISVAGGKPES